MSGDPINFKDRYNRYAEDWRFHHKLIWEIPAITSAIFVGILTVSYLYLDFLSRTVALFVGALLILGLTLSVRKHRFGADLRTNFLYDIGLDKKLFPTRSPEGLEYLKKNEAEEEYENYLQKRRELGEIQGSPDKFKELQKIVRTYKKKRKPRRKFEGLLKRSSETYLIYFMLITFLLLSALCICSAIQTADTIGVLVDSGVPRSQFLENITSPKDTQTIFNLKP